MHATPTKTETGETPITEDADYARVINMFEKQRMKEMSEQYMNDMAKLRQREINFEFKDAYEKYASLNSKYHGIIPNRYIVDESGYQLSIYTKQPIPHSLLCDMPLCKAIYNSLPEYIQKSDRYYPQFPIYSRKLRSNIKQDVSCNMCHKCVSLEGKAW